MADADAVGEPAVAQTTLHSEIVDGTSLWRLRQKGAAAAAEEVVDEWVVCKVVMRCAVLRGGEEVWMVGSYVPQLNADGSWVTSREAPPHKTTSKVNKSPPRKRRAKSCDEPPPASGAAFFAELHADSLLQQLQATSTEEVLRMLEEEEAEALGENGL